LGDFLYKLACSNVVSCSRNICLRHDTDQPTVFLDHRKPAYLMLGHHSQRPVQILLWTDGDELRRRHVANLHLIGVSPLRCDPRRDVAVGQHPDQPVALDNRREADILLPHHLRGVRNGFLCVDGERIGGHDVSDVLRHLSS